MLRRSWEDDMQIICDNKCKAELRVAYEFGLIRRQLT